VEAAADIINVTAIENFTVSGSTANGLTVILGDVNIAAAKSLTISGSNLTTGVLTVNGILETNGSLIVVGGGGADQITGTASTLGDNLSGGAGIDTFFMVTTNLTSADTISGGDGTDIMSMSTTAPVLTDASFTNISSVETLTVTTALAQTHTLGALAMASGLATISTFDTTTALVDTVTVGAGFTNALTLNIGVGVDVITGSASAAALTIATLAASVTAADTLIGGTSTGDVLKLTADSSTATTTLMAGIETITIVAATAKTIGITMGANDLQIAAGKTLVVNGAALTNTSAALTFTGTASELDGSLSVTGGNGADTLTGGGFTDTLIGGIGADRLTGGLSADVLTGGAGADTFVYTSASVAASNGTTFDSITDWTSAIDKLEVTLDYSALTSALTIDATRASAGVAGVSAAQDVLSGSRGQYVYDTTNSVVLINVNNDNLFTTSDFRIGLVAGSTASATVASDGSDINFVITGGNLADVITTGGGADTVRGGVGADDITAGGGNDTVILVAADTSAVTGTNLAAAGTLGGTEAFTWTTSGGYDKINGFANGDTIQLYTTASTAITTVTTAIVAGGIVSAANEGFVGAIVGTQTSTSVFTAATGGADTLLVWDADGTGVGTAFTAIVLVGYTAVGSDTISSAGLFTAA
jgi:Ca2+-binding RTX toxin-like protein